MTDNYLELQNARKTFPGFTLDNITFSLPKGYIMGLIGSNGAGKTTIIKLILNMLSSDGGEISIFGRDNVTEEVHFKQDIGVVFDSLFYVDTWTIKDTEKAVSVFYENWDHTLFQNLTARFKLPHGKKIKDFSRGMQMKLMLACAFSHDAKLLILDEPTSGLDPVTRDELLEILQEYISDGEHSILFSTHITSDLDKIADYVTCLVNGKLFFTGPLDELLSKYRIIKGKPSELTDELRNRIIGLRITDLGFEGLLDINLISSYSGYTIDTPTIENIIIYISREEDTL